MQQPDQLEHLRRQHHPERIRQRLSAPSPRSYLGDAVLGGIDGCVTTFAVVAGVVGAGFPALVALVLGFANLIADGFSMAVSNYQNALAQRGEVERVRREEERHIREVPEGEREEVRQIFASKGFEGEILERIVETITADRERWISTMLVEEHGLQIEGGKPWRAALTTFLAFVLVGALPLLPFLVPGLEPQTTFGASAAVTAAAFFLIGVLKAHVLRQSLWRGGLGTLLLGGSAALLAFVVGAWLRQAYGI